MKGYVKIFTYGCQMNDLDSQKMYSILSREGWEPTESLKEADLIILNTCSVRQKAYEKALSNIGRLRPYKTRKPSLIIAVTGCIAQDIDGDYFRFSGKGGDPVSAVLQKNPARYDALLERYGRRVMARVKWRFTRAGALEVSGDTAACYRYPDMTGIAEGMCGVVRDTLTAEFGEELAYLAAFDAARAEMRAVVEMPENRLDLFIRLRKRGQSRGGAEGVADLCTALELVGEAQPFSQLREEGWAWLANEPDRVDLMAGGWIAAVALIVVTEALAAGDLIQDRPAASLPLIPI